MSARIERVGPDGAPEVLDLVERLLAELGEEGEETGAVDAARLARAWRDEGSRVEAFVAYERDVAVGVVTVAEAFAFYAGGAYGIVQEMYVVPHRRSAGIGTRLLDAVKSLAGERGWRRIDVTAPESPRWGRTRAFYEREGFVFTGPKLRFAVR